jgi:hypothetical protein
MADSILLQKISATEAYRSSRLNTAHWVLQRPDVLEELLKYCFEDASEISYRAAWILEFVCLERFEMLFSQLDYFFENLPAVKRDQAIRPMAHLCEMLCVAHYKKQRTQLLDQFTASHKKILVECAFDWLITDQKVACKVRAMTCLYYLGTEFDWIHAELAAIIRRDMPRSSAGYKSRGKQTLLLIQKFRQSQT